MDWRQAEIFDLICMYRESECLWNCLNPEYKDVELKKNAWKEIATFFGRSVEEVKKKVKNLRTSYVIEKKKAERKNNDSGDSLYEPRLFYFDEMTFLDPVIILRFCTPTEQGADPLCEIKAKRSPNERHIIAEKKRHKVFSSTQEDKDITHSELTPTKRTRDVDDAHFNNVRQNRSRKNPRDVDDVHIDKILHGRSQKRTRDVDDVHVDNILPERPQKRTRDVDDVHVDNILQNRSQKRPHDVDDVHFDNILQDDSENEDRLSKEDTFCAMLCSELKLLKSEDIYDNVTSEIFTILRNAKMAERQIVYQPEEINKVASKKM